MSAPSIVLVEDDPPLRMLAARALQENGFRVRAAATPPEMWLALDSGPTDLILLDIMLPGTNGLDLCREIRKKSEVPIIFISARTSEVDRVLGLEMGADDYLPKPFGTRELVARVRAVLRRGGMDRSIGTRDTEARFDGWVVNFPRRELRSPGGALVDLTGAEFDLLASFLSQPQRVIARERLIEMSRTRLGDASDRSVDVLVSRLRRKLSIDDRPAPIITVRGVGYMFKAEVTQA
ncbi:response regulator transcription factor [uncultured Sphingomonas sp.]|uniref:response regulator transcription factor n=1 Tax=uncultured Sphingomonas sp. TaxID=158754 RepID=UPI0025F44B18|nr:response regulator transcription factor [uncultured Sphingomonas sp.]